MFIQPAFYIMQIIYKVFTVLVEDNENSEDEEESSNPPFTKLESM